MILKLFATIWRLLYGFYLSIVFCQLSFTHYSLIDSIGLTIESNFLNLLISTSFPKLILIFTPKMLCWSRHYCVPIGFNHVPNYIRSDFLLDNFRIHVMLIEALLWSLLLHNSISIHNNLNRVIVTSDSERDRDRWGIQSN